MNKSKIILSALTFLSAGYCLADDTDSLKVVDVEEVSIIATPKENRKLREQPIAVTLLSQENLRAVQVNSVKNLTALIPNFYIPDYGSKMSSALYIRGIGVTYQYPIRWSLRR